VALVQRRQIFVNANRVGEIGVHGVRMRTGTVDLRRFQLRPGELLLRGAVLDRQVAGEVVNDVALEEMDEPAGWRVASLSLSAAGLLRRRRAGRIVPWSEAPTLFATDHIGRQMAALRDLRPADVAATIADMPAA